MAGGRRLRWIAAAVVVLLAGFVAVVLGLQRHLVFPRGYVTVPAEPAPVAGRERLWLSTEEGDVEAWLLPGRGATASHPAPLVIFAHGNAEAIDQWPERLDPYRQWGMSILMVEYRGYGRSAGTPSEAKIVADLVAAYDLVTARDDIDAARVVLHGRSLGGGAVCGLAARRPAAAIVLQSTFTSIVDMAPFFVPRALILDPFDNEQVLRDFAGPVLVAHGRRDGLIPPRHAEALAAAAAHAELVWYEADHNDCPPDWDAFWTDVAAFLDRASLRPSQPATRENT